ncbi:MAG: ATP-binding cassette domain-containing protein [Rhodoferax sp.]|nr:ATP-binding cassette domain-containing protein [Rhodoferax sp.]
MGDTVLNVVACPSAGGLQALNDVGIQIQRGRVCSIIGPNRGWQNHFCNVLTGLYTPDSGSFELAGKSTNQKPCIWLPRQVSLALFQNIRLFSDMTALENVIVKGVMFAPVRGMMAAIFRSPGFRQKKPPLQQERKNWRVRGHWQTGRLQGPHTKLRRSTPP